MRTVLWMLALLTLGTGAFAQRAVSFRLSLPPAGLGLGLEAPLEAVVKVLHGQLRGPSQPLHQQA